MFRFIALICLVHFSVGNTIRGRILLNGDVNQVERVPVGSRLIVRLDDTSIADASEIVLKETEISHLTNFPFYYRIQVPTNIRPTSSYTLAAQIKKGDELLYINEENIPVTISDNNPIVIDIPVIVVRKEITLPPLNNLERLSWPELVGRDGTYAVQYIKEKTGLTNVFTLLEGSIITMDYRTDRVRVFVNEKGIVTQTPRTG